MANVTVTATLPSVTVNQTEQTVNVATTTSNIVIAEVAAVANAEIRQSLSVANVSGFGNLSYDSSNASNGVIQYVGVSSADIRGSISNTSPILYNSSTGVVSIDSNAVFSGKTTDDLTEGSTNLYFTNARADARVNAQTGANLDLSSKTTDNLSEGSTNQYYTTDRANAAIGAYQGSIDTPGNIDVHDITLDGQILVDSSNIGQFTFRGSNQDEFVLDRFEKISFFANNSVSSGYVGDFEVFADTFHLGDPVATSGASDINTIKTHGQMNIRGGDAQFSSSDSQFLKIQTTDGEGGVATIRTHAEFDPKGNVHFYVDPSGRNTAPGYSGGGLKVFNNANTAIFSVGTSDATVTDLNADNLIVTTNVDVTGRVVVNTMTPKTNGNIEVEGNLNVQGNLNYVNVEDLFVNDQSIVLNYGNASSRDAFITVDRSGDSRVNVSLKWNNTSNVWQVTNDGSTFVNLPVSTTDLAEGTNLYYTDGRFDTRFGAKDTDNLSEGVSNLYYTDGRFNTSFGAKSTSDLSEGTNLYFTTARANSAIDARVLNTNANVNTVNGQTGTVVLDTDDIDEGNTKLYFTTDRANSAIDARVTSTTANVNSVNGATGTVVLDTDNIAEGSANLYFTTDRANTSIGAYTGDMASVDDITANTLTTSNAILSQSTLFVQQQSNTAIGGIRAFEGGSTITNFNTNQPALNVENGLITIQASDETSNVFSVPRYAMGKLPDVATLTQDSSDDYGVLGATFDTASAAMPGGVEAPTGTIVSTVNKRRAYNIPTFGMTYGFEGATSHSTGAITFGVDDSNTTVIAKQSFGDVSGAPGFFTAPVANGTITFRTVQTDLLANLDVIAPYNEAVNLANSTVAYMNHKFNIGREDDNTSYNFPKTKGSKKDLLRLADDQGTLEFADQFSGQISAQGNALGPLVFDMEDGDIFTLTTAGDLTSITVNNKQAGTRITIIITQGTTTGALTGSADFLWAGGLKTLSTTTGDIDVIEAVYDGSKFYAQLTKGYVA